MKITKKQLNKIKMIVCDLDGTLFNHKKEISSATITYLIKLQENGYTLVLATGRFFYELKPYIEKYGHEFWTIIDRIISARHAVEAYISREMYIRGFLDYERLVCEIERDV